MNTIKIGITTGDINGVSAEIILKTFQDKRILELCTPVIYGSSKVMAYHKNIVNIDLSYYTAKSAEKIQESRLNIINCWEKNVDITLGKATKAGGECAFAALERATEDLGGGKIDAIVTAPINKEAMKMAAFAFPGHTEYLGEKFGKQDTLMLLVNDGLRVGVVTGHIPLAQVANAVTKNRIINKIKLMNNSLRIDFGIDRPTIAVLGLNPHASDNGVIGKEEEKVIRPAIIQSKKSGILAMGPYAADGFFGSGLYKKFDGILAMYHDQGLVPFKTLSFNAGVNYTAGLSVVRTSPDHGTAYDIVGKNEANPASFCKALFNAISIAKNRKLHAEMSENKLKKRSNRLKQVEERVERLPR